MDTLTRAFRIYDRMVEEDSSGKRPLYRPKDWNIVARRKEKEKFEWSTMGGHIAPIFVPPTPNSELVNSFKVIADSEAEAGIHFKIVETGGLSLKSLLQKSNPLETAGCGSPDCSPVNMAGGNCQGCWVNYEITCQICPEGERSMYLGESS